MPITESDAFALVTKLVESHLHIFQKHGFNYEQSKIINFRASGNMLTMLFSNKITGMQIDLNFAHAANGFNGGFLLYIINIEGKRLNVGKYLLLHGLTKERLLFTYTENVPDFEKYCETFLSMLDQLLSGELKPIIDGKKWEDIPFDWGDYK